MDRLENAWSNAKAEFRKKDWRSIGSTTTVLFSSFYMLQMIAQRTVGMIGLHGGLPTKILAPIGACTTFANLYLSQVAEEKTRELTHQYTFEPMHPVKKLFSPKESQLDKQRRLALSVGAFVVLERGFFRTVFPSSVISIGVFGNVFNRLRVSIPSTSEVATDAQRQRIQSLGRLHGCHQCGSRQMGLQGFIADHMPPTRFAKQAAAVWWRRWFKIAVAQRLYPQCQKCYSLQGNAVRTDVHKLVYHSIIKPFHFSTALGYLAMQHPVIAEEAQQLVDPAVDACKGWVQDIKSYFK